MLELQLDHQLLSSTMPMIMILTQLIQPMLMIIKLTDQIRMFPSQEEEKERLQMKMMQIKTRFVFKMYT